MAVATTSFSNFAQRATAPPVIQLYCGGQEPIFLAALAFCCGILAANYFWRSPFAWLIAFLIALAGAENLSDAADLAASPSARVRSLPRLCENG